MITYACSLYTIMILLIRLFSRDFIERSKGKRGFPGIWSSQECKTCLQRHDFMKIEPSQIFRDLQHQWGSQMNTCWCTAPAACTCSLPFYMRRNLRIKSRPSFLNALFFQLLRIPAVETPRFVPGKLPPICYWLVSGFTIGAVNILLLCLICMVINYTGS